MCFKKTGKLVSPYDLPAKYSILGKENLQTDFGFALS